MRFLSSAARVRNVVLPVSSGDEGGWEVIVGVVLVGSDSDGRLGREVIISVALRIWRGVVLELGVT